MAEITRSRFAGELRDRYGLDPKRDRALVGDLWERYGDDPVVLEDDSKNLREVVDLAEPIVLAVQKDRRRQASAYGQGAGEVGGEEAREVDFTRALGGTGDVAGTEAGSAPREREWIGRRVSAFSEYLTKILAVDEGVIEFRKRALGSSTATLKPEQAERLVRSPAAAFLPFAFFEERGVSLTGHEATTESYEKVVEGGGEFHRATVRVEPAGIRETVCSGELSRSVLESLYWPGLDDNESAQHVRVWSGSVLGGLQRIGKRLSDKHPWQQDQAVHFVLTGAPQLASTLRSKTQHSFNKGVKAHKYNSKSITLEVEHWVPADEVARAYRKMQREAHEGGKTRKPSDRNIAVFQHVVNLSYVRVKSANENLARLATPKWRDMLRLWNRERPLGSKWHYEDEHGKGVQRFHRDFGRGQRTVIGCGCGLPGDPRQPMTRAESKAWHAQFLERLGAKSQVP